MEHTRGFRLKTEKVRYFDSFVLNVKTPRLTQGPFFTEEENEWTDLRKRGVKTGPPGEGRKIM